MRSQPRTQERPEAFQRVDMDFMKTISILIAGVLACGVIDALVLIAPFRQAVIDVVCIGVDQTARRNNAGYHWQAGGLLDIRQQTDHDLAILLEQPQDRRFFLRQGAPATLAFQSPSAARTAFLRHDVRLPLVSRDQVHFVGFNLTCRLHGFFFTTIPSRSCVVMSLKSSKACPHAWHS
jgi:hypothetical protein